MPSLIRPKHPTVYAACANFWQGGPVWFVAHIIRAGGGVTQIAGPSADGAGHPATSHPDQRYWAAIDALDLAHAVRIEIDCTLMPCREHGHNSCLYRVPRLIRDRGGAAIAVRFFSHRNENLGDSAVQRDNKRYFNCATGMDNDALGDAYDGHGHWTWAPMPAAGPGARTYDQY